MCSLDAAQVTGGAYVQPRFDHCFAFPAMYRAQSSVYLCMPFVYLAKRLLASIGRLKCRSVRVLVLITTENIARQFPYGSDFPERPSGGRQPASPTAWLY